MFAVFEIRPGKHSTPARKGAPSSPSPPATIGRAVPRTGRSPLHPTTPFPKNRSSTEGGTNTKKEKPRKPENQKLRAFEIGESFQRRCIVEPPRKGESAQIGGKKLAEKDAFPTPNRRKNSGRYANQVGVDTEKTTFPSIEVVYETNSGAPLPSSRRPLKEQKTAVTHASQFRLMRLPYGRTTTKPSDDQAPMPNRTLLIYAFATGPSFPLHAQSTKQKPHRQETQRILKEKTCFCEAVPTSPRRRNLGESPRGDTRVVALFSSKRSKPARVQFNESVVQSSIAPTFKLVSYVM